MSMFHAQILTPEGTVYEGEVKGVQMPGSEGLFEVKANHAPIVSTLDKGNVLVRTSDGEDNYSITGGFVEVSRNKLTLLTESAVRSEV